MYFNVFVIFFFNDTATTEIYTLSLHDALPISATILTPDPERAARAWRELAVGTVKINAVFGGAPGGAAQPRKASGLRSEEHTSELQSRQYLVCRLLLEKKKKTSTTISDNRIYS